MLYIKICPMETCVNMLYRKNQSTRNLNPFWDSKPELFSNIACLRIPYPPCIALFRNFFSGTTASNRRELRLHLNVVPTGAGVFKSRHILLHKYVNRIMIIYLWHQIQFIIPSRLFTRMLHGKNLTQWHWPLTLKINRVLDSPKD
jgi:hypothetical protein